MPGLTENTTNFGSGQSYGRPGTIRIRSNGVADNPGVIQLDAVNASGTVTTYRLWVDDTGQLRRASSYPTNQDSDGVIVGDIAERQVIVHVPTLVGGSDIAGRPFFAPEGPSGSTFSLVRGSFVSIGTNNVPSGQTLTVGLTSPAGTVVSTGRTSSLTAGGRLALGSFSNTSLNAGQVVRFNITQTATATLNSGGYLQVAYRRRS